MLDRITHYVLVHLVLASVLTVSACFHKNCQIQPDLSHFGSVIISQQGKYHQFIVEIADTPQKRARGLMHRSHLEPDRGMLFIFETSERHSFWMKNTSLSLDVIFMDENFKIVDVIPNAHPHSTAAIVPEQACKYVLEINHNSIIPLPTPQSNVQFERH